MRSNLKYWYQMVRSWQVSSEVELAAAKLANAVALPCSALREALISHWQRILADYSAAPQTQPDEPFIHRPR